MSSLMKKQPFVTHIREARESDLQAIRAADLLLVTVTLRSELVQHSVLNRECLVAQEDSDRIIGYIILNYTFFGQGFIPLLVVAAEFRRKRIGQALLQAATERCKRPKIFTSGNGSNRAARALFESCAFVYSGAVSNLDPDDEHFYFKRLRES